MASIFPNLEYDIFISYRHNDNRSGWVTEFVEALQQELAATVKEPLSIYFDKNPHDGLLETHHVDKSLEGKLKCLIFIPIISQTYCDPKSFAWQREFCAFNSLAKADSIGREVRLSNCNVTSRILPVRIHDLDPEDKSTIEAELGSVLRSIDFIFKTPGVNRPLRANEDHANDNQNRTFYRDQINKVANAIKETISALKNPTAAKPVASSFINQAPATRRGLNRKWVIAAGIVLMLLVGGYFVINALSPFKKINKSIAVLPFENLSGDQDAYFAAGVTEDILTQISNIGDLRVLSRFTLKEYDTKGKTVQQIGEELGVAYLLTGNIRKIGDQLRISCQLVQVNPEEQTWAANFDKRMEDVFAIQNNVAQQVARNLKAKLTDEEKDRLEKKPTENMEAYHSYLQALSLYDNNRSDDNEIAIKLFRKAVALDPNFIQAQTGLIRAYNRSISNYGVRQRAFYDSTFIMAQKAFTMDPESADATYTLGYQYLVKRENAKAIELAAKAVEINPNHVGAINGLGLLKRNNGQIDEAMQLFLKIKLLEPLKVNVYQYNIASCYQFLEMYPEALSEYESLLGVGKAESITLNMMGRIYANMGQKEKVVEVINRQLTSARNTQNLNRAVGHAFYGKLDPAIVRQYVSETFNQKDFNYVDHTEAALAKAYFLKQSGKKDSLKLILDNTFNELYKVYGEPDDSGGLYATYAEIELLRDNPEKADKWLEKITASENVYGYYIVKNDFMLKPLYDKPVLKGWLDKMERKSNQMRLAVSAIKDEVRANY